jgi:hypothetical protein
LGLGKNLDYSPGRVKPRPDMAPQFPFEDRRLAGGYPWKRRLFSWGDRAVCVGRGKSEYRRVVKEMIFDFARREGKAKCHVRLLARGLTSKIGALRDLLVGLVVAVYRACIASTNGQCGGFLRTNIAPALQPGDRVIYLGDLDLAGDHIETNTRRVLEREIGGAR